MKKIELKKAYFFFILVLIALLILTLINYSSLPDQMPIQWSGTGLVSNFVEKGLFVVTLLIMLAGTLWMYFLEKTGRTQSQSQSDRMGLMIALLVLIGSQGFILIKALF